MFQYTHELIFNSLTMPDGTKRLVRNGGSSGPLTIKRGGEYWKNFVQMQTVYKTVGNVGKNEILKIDVEKFADLFQDNDEATFMAPGTYQLNMFVKLLDPNALYEFGYPNWNTFGRQILIGFDVTASDTAADVAAKLYESLKMAVREEEFKVGGLVAGEAGADATVGDFEEDATVVAMRANHYALRFDTVGLAFYDETTCDSCMGEYLDAISIFDRSEGAQTAATIAVEGVVPFATGEWLIENLRFPTYPNIRYWGVGDQDRPIPGVVYVQYSFGYESPRPQLGGLSGVGQAMYAVTRHVYYVPAGDLADEFEQAFKDLGLNVVAVNEMEVTDPDANTTYTPGGVPMTGEGAGEGSNAGSDAGSNASSNVESNVASSNQG